MATVDEHMNMARFVARPGELEVSEISKPTECIIKEIQPAPLVRSGYRPSDLLFEKFAFIAFRIVLVCQYDMSAVHDPFERRRSDVLVTTLFAEPQWVRKIRELLLQLRWHHLAVDSILNLRLALTLCPEVVRQTNVRTIFDVQNFALKPIEELVVWLLNGPDHPVQRGRLQKRYVLAHESNQGRLVGLHIRWHY
jgi:hypothetical protein